MYELCRHIKTDNTRCGSPAIKDQLYRFHHRVINKALAKYEAQYAARARAALKQASSRRLTSRGR